MTTPPGATSLLVRDTPLIILANFVSEVTASLQAREVMLRGMVQAPRKIWLTRPGDVVVTPVPVSDAFRSYACELLGFDPAMLDVVTVPTDPATTLSEAVHRAGLVDPLRDLIADRPGVALLPTTLDRAAVGLAAELGVLVHPYGPAGVPDSALEVARRLNTKAGFRELARKLGVRVPDGRFCTGGTELADVVRELLGDHPRVAVKPNRSAGGEGFRVLSRTDLPDLDASLTACAAAAGMAPEGWVVEEHVDFIRDVSVQLEVEGGGLRVLFSGEMRTTDGSFCGYRAPLHDVPRQTRRELEQGGLAFGAYLAERGYLGPFDIDAGLTADGTLYATESNVRHTATSTPAALVHRLLPPSYPGTPTWLVGCRPATVRHDFAQALRLLQRAHLAYDPYRVEGVVLHTGAPADDNTWRYTIIGPDRTRVEQIDTELTDVLKMGHGSGGFPRRYSLSR
ncbi:hypothetical protein GCM10012275_33110 [Longimycelium tulufanense]|uniref:ATP-grasp domain-containing protein n=1 Tax=Longimycelium tulufanense TaxID=907463 RepID=A0A8J3FWF4_9PSEU|nr:peptide ligase PGM1-related protein [Longimycelium tulufanense]GGM59320.1 hypothetical protein GCM10012275_33110 [Longimycelium tulufanense]